MDMLSSAERVDLQHACNGLQDEDPSWDQLPSRVSAINVCLLIPQYVTLHVICTTLPIPNVFPRESLAFAEPNGKDGEH